jgi:hypothetical protein
MDHRDRAQPPTPSAPRSRSHPLSVLSVCTSLAIACWLVATAQGNGAARANASAAPADGPAQSSAAGPLLSELPPIEVADELFPTSKSMAPFSFDGADRDDLMSSSKSAAVVDPRRTPVAGKGRPAQKSARATASAPADQLSAPARERVTAPAAAQAALP